MKRILLITLVLALMAGAITGCSKGIFTGSGDPDKKAMLVVSFGTSYHDTREKTIDVIEERFVEEFPEYDMVRAWTSQIIIDILMNRDEIEVFNITEAMEYLKSKNYSEVVVQPTLVMNGAEYDDVVREVMAYEEDFASIKIGQAMLTSVEDYETVVEALKNHMPERTEKEAVVLMGHGTHHDANAVYSALDYNFEEKGVLNTFVGTVEGYPEFEHVVKKLEKKKIEKVTLMPFMIVSGDHAENDMAGDEDDSWKTMLKKDGYIVDTKMMGLGEMPELQELFIEHAKTAISSEEH